MTESEQGALAQISEAEQYAVGRIDLAEAALAEAGSIVEVRDIRDKMEAIRVYLAQQKGGLRLQNRAAEVKLKAERKLGRWLAEAEKHPAGRPEKNRLQAATDLPPTRKDLGIERTAAHRWQAEATVSEPAFRAYVEEKQLKADEVTSAGLYRLAREGERKARQERLVIAPLPRGQFRTIEIDPPWALDSAEGKSAAPQYSVMTLDRILDELVPKIKECAAPNSHLYLWAINPMLPEAFTVMKACGFDYKTLITWVKSHFGTGHYYRGATEHCLFGVHGRLACLRADQANWFEAPRGRHSEKPEKFYEIVESMSPGPRIRLCARDERDGWESWINE